MMEVVPESAPASPSPPHYAPQPLRFTGTGGDYFRIWIVNLLLTIVTLGFYSPWAKVRRLHYFYRHTEVAGSSFDFHGDPVRILIGRIVALVLLATYNISVRLRSPWTLLIVIGLMVVMPWLLRNSFRFRLFNTSWRGTRFHFRGNVAGAYRVFLLNGFLTLITLYIMAPFMHQRLKAYQHDNTWFGRTRCSFHASAGQFYLLYLLPLAGLIAFFVVFAAAGIASTFIVLGQRGRVSPTAVIRAMVILYGLLIVLGTTIGPVFRALITNLIWNNTRLGEHRIECRVPPATFLWITFSNLVLVVITLGLFTPWASVRLAKLQLESVRLLPVSDLQEFVDTDPETPGAIGEEAAAVFDFDIAL